ncbi:MAG: hypothetical protein U5N86_03845 [Planctomycetota bacterium]|nr:hypothetical protein [Planctomycetota bacterium]
MSTVANNLNVNTVLRCAANYANRRNTFVFRLMPARPIAELRRAIDLFRTSDYSSAAGFLVENVLCRDTTAEYYHMALCYISRCFARTGDLAAARRVAGEIARIKLPPNYARTASELVDEVQTDLAACERNFKSRS